MSLTIALLPKVPYAFVIDRFAGSRDEDEPLLRFAAAYAQAVEIWLVDGDPARSAALARRCAAIFSAAGACCAVRAIAGEKVAASPAHHHGQRGAWITRDPLFGFAQAQRHGLLFAPFPLPGELPPTTPSKAADEPSPLRVAVVGPESTGKSTLCRQLAQHFSASPWVPEYARIYADAKGVALTRDDVEPIARGHYALELALAPGAHGALFVDTDALMTQLYADIYYQFDEPWLSAFAQGQSYDIYLVTAPDVPWIEDPQRDLPHLREQFFERCIARLKQDKRRYLVLRGSWERRFEAARQEVEKMCREAKP